MAEPPLIADVVATGNRRNSLIALRDRLASELDEERAAKHKRECSCTCGMGDGRVIVAIGKELRAVIDELDRIPGAQEEDPLDVIAAGVTDELAGRRAARGASAS
jgi:hypothetical protein